MGKKRGRPVIDVSPCGVMHNHGRWPYLTVCILAKHDTGDHKDKAGNTWPNNRPTLKLIDKDKENA